MSSPVPGVQLRLKRTPFELIEHSADSSLGWSYAKEVCMCRCILTGVTSSSQTKTILEMAYATMKRLAALPNIQQYVVHARYLLLERLMSQT